MKYVKYLESDGNSYFNTITSFPSGTYKIEMKYNDDTIISTHNDRLIGLTSNVFYYQINQYGVRQVKDVNRNNDQYKDKVVNNILTDTFEMPFNTSTLRIFHTETVAQIYYVKLYDTSDNLLYHFRGALDDNNTPCLHEVVNDIVYYNNGSGTFAHGDFVDALYLFADNNEGTAENFGSYRLYNMKIDGDLEGIKADEINYVDYLEGDGASYIDTGIYANTQYKYELQFEDTTLEAYENLFGANIQGFSFQRRGTENRFEINYMSVNSGAVGTYPTTKATILVDKNKVYCDDVLIKEFNVTNNTTAFTRTTYLFDRNPIDVRSNAKVYYFKMWNENNELVLDFRPCLDTEGVPCMYDEVSKQYFYNQGNGTFGYKKKLRDFQPVLDSNGVPCLMDKINKKYYYDKNGKGFGCDRYSGVSYIKSDKASWIDTGLIANQMHGYRIETKIINKSVNTENTILFGSSQGGMDSADVNCHLRYNYYGYSQGLTFIEDSGTGQGWSMKVNEIYTFVMTINQPTSSNSFYLCAGNERDNAIGVCDCGIYYWKVYDTNNNLIQHLIPAIDTDGSIGMYDLVTETFFYNQGTGTFSYGIEELEECPPANYVEYIKGGTNAYVNTLDISGMINGEVEVEWKFNLEATNKNTAWFGTMGSYGTFPFYAINKYNYSLKANEIKVSLLSVNNTVTIKTEDRHVGVHVMKINKTGLYMDGNLEAELSEFTYNNTYRFVQPFALLGYNHYNNGIQDKGWDNILYYVTVKQAGELILDFRPCLDENGVLCVYEAVNEIYYYNSDTGEFGGHGKSLGYTPIKYIETNGTQYIDTGVVVNDNTYMDIDYRAVDKLHYIEDGLILRLDAIDNTRDGHNPSSTVWEDLSGNGLDFDLTDVTVNDTNMSFNGTSSYGILQDIELWRNIVNNTEQYTVELCYRFTNTSEVYQAIISTNLGNVNVARFVNALQVGEQDIGATIDNDANLSKLNTLSANADDVTYYINTIKIENLTDKNDYIYPPNTDVFWIGARLSSTIYRFTGEICSIRIYNKKLTDEERLYNHSSDVARYGVITDVSVIDTSKNYLMNDFYTDTTYKYKEIDTTVEPNLTASTGATLTLGSTYIAHLTESEIEQAIKNGWIIQ